MEERPFINRILVSLVTALSYAAMSLSGIAAFIVPHFLCRIELWSAEKRRFSQTGFSSNAWR
jgi:hypothetical protein